jgi:hypothetical protein
MNMIAMPRQAAGAGMARRYPGTADGASCANIMRPSPAWTQVSGKAITPVTGQYAANASRKGGKDVQNENFPLRCTIR